MRTRSALVAALVALLAPLAACGGDDNSTADDPDGGAPAGGDTVCGGDGEITDLLAEICEKGVLTVSTDPAIGPRMRT